MQIKIPKLNSSQLKTFLFLYLVVFSVINWSDISWLLNYKAVSSLIDDFINPYQNKSTLIEDYYAESPVPTIIDFPIIQKINESAIAKATNERKVNSVASDKENVLEIPQISVVVPIFFPETADKNLLKKDLDKGVVYYPGSVAPEEAGQIVILGHSAPPNWPKIKNDWVFSDLNSLKVGDEIYLNKNYKRYTYKIKETKIIARGQEIYSNLLTNDNNMVVLVSCWPPGKDYQRITVWAELQ